MGRKIKRAQQKQKNETRGVKGYIQMTNHPKNRVNKLAKRQKIFTSRNPKLEAAIGENLVGLEGAT